MIHPKNDPDRRCWKVEEWPEFYRQAWQATLAPTSILDGTSGSAQYWRPETREKNRKGFGRFVNFLSSNGHFEGWVPPANLVTFDNVAAYLNELATQVASFTQRNRLSELLAVASTFSPDEDWSWLRRLVAKLNARAKDARDKRPRMKPAHEILDWALTWMAYIAAKNHTVKRDAAAFRNALTIAVLIDCSILRRRNLAAIIIGQHLRRTSRGYRLLFTAAETKTSSPIDAPLHEDVGVYVDLYLQRFRPLLLGANDTNSLWISWRGRPMSPMALYHRIIATTTFAFGISINPHLFRDCAVTTTMIEDPEHIGIAPHILGHDNERTTHTHYNQAGSLEACRRLSNSMATLKAQLRPATAGARRRPAHRSKEQRT